MRFTINGACASDTGKIRNNNEDNFFFCGTHLPALHSGTNKSRHFEVTLRRREIMAVFDGMGGENFGEEASHAAALRLCRVRNSLLTLIYPHTEFLSRSIIEMNQAVVEKKREFYTEQMGTTFVMASFERNAVWICNLGDSRGYLLRNRELKQISVDHVEKFTGQRSRKAPLTQYLGIDPEELCIEPYMERVELIQGDRLLLCSDGLTDMLTDLEITAVMLEHDASYACVQALIDAALANGGRDNITVIVVSIR